MAKKQVKDLQDIKITIDELMQKDGREDKNALFNTLLDQHSPETLVYELYKLSDLNQYDFAKQIKDVDAIRFSGREIKTIATYFPYIGWGGTERVLLALQRIWTEMGYRVIVVTDLNAKEDALPLNEGVERDVIDDGFYDYKSRANSIVELINKYKIDVVVYHDWNPANMIWDELLTKLCGAAFIRHCHTVFSLELYRPSRKLQDYVAPYLLADAVVTLSDPNKEFWKCFNDNVFAVKNPFVKNFDGWKQSNCDGHDIVWVARIAPEKNPDDLIPIMQAVLEEVPDARLHVIGSNTFTIYWDSFKRAVYESGLNDNIVLHGFQNDVAAYYNKAAVYLMTSRFEGDPLTLQEALFSGLPIVMYELPYVTLTQNNPGIISRKQGDVRGTAKAIIDLLNHPETRKEIGRRGKLFFEQYLGYDFEMVWASIFDSLGKERTDFCSSEKAIMMETLIKHYDIGTAGSLETRRYMDRKAVRYAIRLINTKDHINDRIIKEWRTVKKALKHIKKT